MLFNFDSPGCDEDMVKNAEEDALSNGTIEGLQQKIALLEESVEKYNAAFFNIIGKSLDGILIVDFNKIVVYANSTAMNLLNRNMASLLGHPIDINIKLGESNSDNQYDEISITHKNGEGKILEVSIFSSVWHNAPCYVISLRDITERKKSVERFEYLSHHDSLTALPNRVFFEKKMKQALSEAKETGSSIALLYLDLDHFKNINDTMGHDIGDLLLKKVSTKLHENIRSSDMVARLGGDEFAIILHNIQDSENVKQIARKIIEKFETKIRVQDNNYIVTVSIGIAIFPRDGFDVVTLLKHADTSMYRAKRNGKNQFFCFSMEMNHETQREMKILNGLQNAIQNNEFFLVYQPIIDLKNNRCFGMEALLRWQHPELGLIMPAEFLKQAEDIYIIQKIGRWVLRHVLIEYKTHKWKHLFISINLTAKELNIDHLVDGILQLVKQVGVHLPNLIFEITETSVMRYTKELAVKFKKLMEVGIKIAVDDFGTGYSSLQYLRQLPISIIKIDKLFVDEIGLQTNAEIIIKSIIHLAHNLKIRVIAEGVEKEEQIAFLKENNCDYIQGYYFSKPILPGEMDEYLVKTKTSKRANS